jgi:hypothetical protein
MLMVDSDADATYRMLPSVATPAHDTTEPMIGVREMRRRYRHVAWYNRPRRGTCGFGAGGEGEEGLGGRWLQHGHLRAAARDVQALPTAIDGLGGRTRRGKSEEDKEDDHERDALHRHAWPGDALDLSARSVGV